MNLKFTGGPLRSGDFIAIAYNNHFTLGFFAGYGRGTVQYYYLTTPADTYTDYLNYKQDASKFGPYKRANEIYAKRFANGFTKKSLWKAYVNAPHGNRIIKLENPEYILDQETLQKYNDSREALIEAKIIQQ